MHIHDGSQVWLGHSVLERIDIGQHGGGLGVPCESWAELGLDTGKGSGKLGSGGRSSFDLGEGFMEDLCDIKQTDNVSVVVAYGLELALDYLEVAMTYQVSEVSADHKLESFSGAGGIPRDHRVLGHDLSNGSDPGVE